MRLNRLNQLVVSDGVVKEGRWVLTKGHELQYRRRGAQREIILSGQLLRAEPSGLAFRVSELRQGEDSRQWELTLRGRWEVDSRNRLAFRVERQQGKEERLILQGAWELDSRQTLLYRWEKKRQILRFEGVWDIGKDRRLVYQLEGDSDSQFRFRGAFQTPSILAQEGAIRYQLGLEVGGKRRVENITLFGKWKLSRDLDLSFEMPSRDGSVRQINFKAEFSLGRRGALSAELMAADGKPLGIEVLFSRPFLHRDGEAFVRLRKRLEETAVEGGVRLRW